MVSLNFCRLLDEKGVNRDSLLSLFEGQVGFIQVEVVKHMELQGFGVRLEHTRDFLERLVGCVTLSVEVLTILETTCEMFYTLHRFPSSREASILGHEETNTIKLGLNIERFADVLLTVFPLVGQHGQHLDTLRSFIVPHGLRSRTGL